MQGQGSKSGEMGRLREAGRLGETLTPQGRSHPHEDGKGSSTLKNKTPKDKKKEREKMLSVLQKAVKDAY